MLARLIVLLVIHTTEKICSSPGMEAGSAELVGEPVRRESALNWGRLHEAALCLYRKA